MNDPVFLFLGNPPAAPVEGVVPPPDGGPGLEIDQPQLLGQFPLQRRFSRLVALDAAARRDPEAVAALRIRISRTSRSPVMMSARTARRWIMSRSNFDAVPWDLR
ncbi:hypothetical protein J2R78_003465 [Bradyrhizobium sp. USDA 4538]|nr:hypothetical protein [Bradyrhizobium sp. USDA 4538]MCP1901062.1 hypothetical protein [Bradyrhizobium sp. USDA 4537]MCP1993282.1 hypothetical protein [Bradyrhizobium sp. USDA 4539]